MVKKPSWLKTTQTHTWHINQEAMSLSYSRKESSPKPTQSKRKSLLQDGQEPMLRSLNHQKLTGKTIVNLTKHLSYQTLEDQCLKVSTMRKKSQSKLTTNPQHLIISLFQLTMANPLHNFWPSWPTSDQMIPNSTLNHQTMPTYRKTSN